MTPRDMAGFWNLLGQTWGSRFIDQYGPNPNDAWAACLASVPVDVARDALKKLIAGGSPFPPTLPEFIALAKTSKPVIVPPILTYQKPTMTPEQVEQRRREMYGALGRRIPGG
jgi:hypothetical protein